MKKWKMGEKKQENQGINPLDPISSYYYAKRKNEKTEKKNYSTKNPKSIARSEEHEFLY